MIIHSEAVVIEITNQHSHKIKLASIYCSPSAKSEESKKFFNDLTSLSGAVIAGGDFNAKHKMWNNSTDCRRGSYLLKLMNQKNFTVHSPDNITLMPSRGDFSVVDFVISKSFSNISPVKVLNDLSSDHLPIVFDIDFDFPFNDEQTFFNFSKANWKKFRQTLETSAHKINEEHVDLSSASLIDACIENVNHAIIQAASESIPKKKQYSHRYPYNQLVNNLRKQRNHHRNMLRKTKLPYHKSMVSQLNQLIAFHTNEMCENNFSNKVASLNIRDLSLYQFSKNLKRKKCQIPPLKNEHGEISYSMEQKSELFAKCFEKSHKITQDWPSKHQNKVKKSINSLKKDKSSTPVTEFFHISELQYVIKSLKTRKAPGDDGILNIFIKNLPLSFKKIFLNIFNACLKISHFPISWKVARIFPIQKPGKDFSSPSAYRPISLLSNVGKLFEKLLLIRLNKFIGDKKIIKNHQFGFREQHSTTQQLIRLSKFVSLGFNNNQSTGAMSLDIEKAFDTTWHDGLIHKLIKAEMPLFLVKIIQSYLEDRKAFVSLMGKNSFIFDVVAGVPQGSLLAPLLFIIFINDLPTPKDCELGTYADDTILYTKTQWKNVKTLKNRLEKGFITVEKYFREWKIKINNEKTEAIIFTQSHKMNEIKNNYQVQVGGVPIKWKDEIPYLGVELDSKLSFKKHTDTTLRKSNGIISTLFSIFKKDSTLPTHLKLLVYKLYIRPIFTYAAPLLANAPITQMNRLQVMQNKCLRMALSMPRYTMVTELHELAKIPTVAEFIKKLSDSFYDRSRNVANDFVNSLGTYNLPPNLRIKHRLPMKVSR